jgi:hypothetical protein
MQSFFDLPIHLLVAKYFKLQNNIQTAVKLFTSFEISGALHRLAPARNNKNKMPNQASLLRVEPFVYKDRLTY